MPVIGDPLITALALIRELGKLRWYPDVPHGTQMYLTWRPGEDGPEGFYWKLGFQLTGEKSQRQTVGVLDLTNA
jgi:hypothetical protein